MSEEEEDEAKISISFGETDLGGQLGCGWIILCLGATYALIMWAYHTFN